MQKERLGRHWPSGGISNADTCLHNCNRRRISHKLSVLISETPPALSHQYSTQTKRQQNILKLAQKKYWTVNRQKGLVLKSLSVSCVYTVNKLDSYFHILCWGSWELCTLYSLHHPEAGANNTANNNGLNQSAGNMNNPVPHGRTQFTAFIHKLQGLLVWTFLQIIQKIYLLFACLISPSGLIPLRICSSCFSLVKRVFIWIPCHVWYTFVSSQSSI